MNAAKSIGRSVGAKSPAGGALQQGSVPELARLEGLPAPELHIQWRELFGRDAPRRLGPELMKRAIAYRLQELAIGGLSRTAELRLKAAGAYRGKSGNRGASRAPIIKRGTRFVREWNGETHEVLASGEGGFAYRGKAYRSLSVIARKITGTHQSGPRFFGLPTKGAKAQVKEAADAQ